MANNKDCKFLAEQHQRTCLGLATIGWCPRKLKSAVGHWQYVEEGDKCKKALGSDGNIPVEKFCPVTCKKCPGSKFDNTM